MMKYYCNSVDCILMFRSWAFQTLVVHWTFTIFIYPCLKFIGNIPKPKRESMIFTVISSNLFSLIEYFLNSSLMMNWFTGSPNGILCMTSPCLDQQEDPRVQRQVGWSQTALRKETITRIISLDIEVGLDLGLTQNTGITRKQ